MAELGYTFQPSDEKMLRAKTNQRVTLDPLNPRAQEAIKILSLRLPKMLGGSPMAPEDLLRPGVGRTPQPSAQVGAPMSTIAPPPGRPPTAPGVVSPTTQPFVPQMFSPSAPIPSPQITPGVDVVNPGGPGPIGMTPPAPQGGPQAPDLQALARTLFARFGSGPRPLPQKPVSEGRYLESF
jgi:hypothetical protein